MVEVRAFRPIEFDLQRQPLAHVASPPFDVIDAAQLKAFQKKSPFNVTRLTLPGGARDGPTKRAASIKAGSGPKPTSPAETAAQFLESWLREGVLIQRPEECVYAYEVHHDLDGAPRRMRGVMLTLRLDPAYRTVRPHERVFDKPVEERLDLLRATSTDMEPIKLIYPGKSAEMALWGFIDGSGRKPELEAIGVGGATHRFWRVADPAVIGTLVEGFKGRKAYIADGHHRYATALAYAKERRSLTYRAPKIADFDFKLCVLVNAEDAGYAILPTHRVVLKAPRSTQKKVLDVLSEWFEAEPVADVSAAVKDLPSVLPRAGNPSFLVYFGRKAGAIRLTSRAAAVPEDAAPGQSLAWRSVDTALLQQLIVGQGFAIPEPEWGDVVRYTQDAEEAINAVDSKKAVAAILHRPVSSAQLRAVADAGQAMPAKSTFFVPKLLTGAAMYPLGKPDQRISAPVARSPS